MVRPTPMFLTAVPRTRPSVGFRQIARTRLSPICWATSARTSLGWPSMVMSKLSIVLICGTASGGNSTSITGPAMATTRPSLRVDWLSVTVIRVSPVSVAGGEVFGVPLAGDVEHVEGLVGEEVGAAGLALAEGLGPADDLHDLGGDGVLAGPVHHAAELGDQLFGVVGGGLHGPLLGGEERGGALEQGRVE